jgi:hypothetical protein
MSGPHSNCSYLALVAACLLAASCLAGGGCQPAGSGAAATASAGGGLVADPPEPSLAEQIAAVRRGESTRILAEHEVLGDGDLVALAELPSLVDILLDNAQSRYSPRGIAALAALPNLQHVRLRGRDIDDDCLREMARIKRLRILNVPQGAFTDQGLGHLAVMPDLESFRFGSPHVSDDGMKTIARWPAIRMLHLIDVPITDAGLAELAGIERLQSLYIDGGRITDAGWDALFRRRPTLHVHVNQQHLDRDPNKHAHSPGADAPAPKR